MAVQDDSEQLLHLKLAFLAGEPPACVLALARKAGGGCLTKHVQQFILENCMGTNVEGRQNCTYSTTILKRIISELELSSDVVIDELYEEFAQRVLSKAKDSLLNRPDRIYKEISFLSPTNDNVSPGLVSMVAHLSCSSNMLEGDTGCSLWPSSLFLSEFILSNPTFFSKKCCFELGSGVGLVGIGLNYVGASKVECKYLSWEEVSESDLWGYQPDIVLGADIIYDPVCVPHLTRVLSILLRRDGEFVAEGPVAYIATVVRNVDTFHCFAKAAAEAKLSISNITSDAAPANFLPYMLSYDRSSVQLLKITSLS